MAGTKGDGLTTRRDFVRRGALWALAAAVLPYEEIAERLNWTPKKLWTGHDFGRYHIGEWAVVDHHALVSNSIGTITGIDRHRREIIITWGSRRA
jgi:hypothetical protein